jgi:2-polyprenyl-3-methyl-5-hydroxy-6-metoxy-1,4-benzoquinol methylase
MDVPSKRMIEGYNLKNTVFSSFKEVKALKNLDYIISADVLEHVEDLDNVLSVFKNSLSKSGKLIISGPTETKLYKLGRWVGGFQGHHFHKRNVYDIHERIIKFGFRVIKRVKLLLFPTLFEVIVYEHD